MEHDEKYIEMSTNISVIGSLIREIAITFHKCENILLSKTNARVLKDRASFDRLLSCFHMLSSEDSISYIQTDKLVLIHTMSLMIMVIEER